MFALDSKFGYSTQVWFAIKTGSSLLNLRATGARTQHQGKKKREMVHGCADDCCFGGGGVKLCSGKHQHLRVLLDPKPGTHIFSPVYMVYARLGTKLESRTTYLVLSNTNSKLYWRLN